ncbi:MAG: fibronectin type III domain-containing protein [Clostridiales bacterium]|jgi:hypothetical protein|nr:fibronectin type III domain-containing protein [Clostridiales bacterium]
MKKLRKPVSIIIAAALALILLTSVFREEVLAHTQNAVTGAQMYAEPGGGTTGSYNLRFQWPKPVNGPATVPEHDPPDGSTGGYELLYAQGSTTALNPVPIDPDPPIDSAAAFEGVVDTAINAMPLAPGSLYVFRAQPFHTHLTPFIDANGNPQVRRDTIIPQTGIKDMLFLTDIRVTGSGSGNSITVNWDNPLLNNDDFFDSWEIRYGVTGGRATTVSPNVLTEDLIGSGTNRLSYVITDSSIIPGRSYTVTVEPLLNGQRIRRENTQMLYPVPQDERFSCIAFSPLSGGGDGEYRVSGIRLDMELRINMDISTGESGLMTELSWDSLAGGGISVDDLKILYSENKADLEAFYNYIYGLGPEVPQPRDLGVISGNIQTINKFLTPSPGETMYYMLWVTFEDGGVEGDVLSNIVSYDPSSTPFKPNAPMIRDFSHFETDGGLALNVTWDAFLRNPYGDEEPTTTDGKYLDLGVEYAIFVADEYATLERIAADPNNAEQSVNGRYLQAGPGSFTFDDREYTYSQTIGETEPQVWSLVNGELTQVPVTENKIYYVRVIARQFNLTTNEPVRENTASADASWFVPAKGIDANPVMLSKPPLRVDSSTADTITAEWDLQYYEAYNKADNTWYSRVGYDGAKLVFGPDISNQHRPVDLVKLSGFEMNGDVQKAKDKLRELLGLGQNDINDLALRYVDYTARNGHDDVKFAMHWVPLYSEAFAAFNGDVDAYAQSIWGTDAWGADGAGGIKPVEDPNYAQNAPSMRYTITGLPANDSQSVPYLIILWPYVTDDIKALSPSNVIGYTVPARGPLDVQPIVPALEAVEAFETSLAVKWPYNEELKYELRYSELLSDYPEGGNLIPDGDIERDVRDGYIYYTIENLFPETTYYIWIRSYAENEGGRIDSGWSGALTMRTLELTPPPPPRGLGLVGDNSLDIINKQREPSEEEGPLLKVDENYAILEWLRVSGDEGSPEGAADEGAEEGPVGQEASGRPLTIQDNPINSYIVQFSGLEVNTSYYARVKTVLTVTKGGTNGASARSYQYVIQLSKYEDFSDASEIIEVTVPGSPEGEGGEAESALTKESAWSDVVHIYTAMGTGEYDANVDPQTYPLPDEDFELIYDRNTNTLTYRFRSDGEDAAGVRDNGVDNRFINRLIASRTYDYTVDLSTYNGIIPKRRVLELPYSVYGAMADRHISTTVICGDTTYSLPAQFMNGPEVWAITGYGYGAVIQVIAEDAPAGLPGIDLASETYAANPQRLTLRVTVGTRAADLEKTVVPIGVTQTLKDTGLFARNIAAIGYTQSAGRWAVNEHTQNVPEGTVTQMTQDIGSYAVVARQAPRALTADAGVSAAIANVNKRMALSGLEYYDQNADVSSSQFNKLVAAVAKSSPAVRITDQLTPGEYSSLAKSAMLAADSDALLREEAVPILVKLYELKIKEQIKEYTPLVETRYLDILAAAPQYQPGLLKAADLGLLDGGVNAARPKDAITFGELIKMVDLIMQYSE